MKCIICHGDDIENKTVIEEIHKGNDVIQMQIKVAVCNSCGERYYDRKTMIELQVMQSSVMKDSAGLSEVGKVLAYHK